MDETSNVPMTMLVGPTATGNAGGYPYPVYMNGSNGGFGNGMGGDGWWILLILLALGGGWNNGFGGGFGGGAGNEFAWLLNGQNGINNNVSDGFRSAAISSQLGDIQNSITTGFSNSEVAACNRAIDALQTAYTNQIADLNRSFDSQTAITAGQNAIQSQLAKCLKKTPNKAKGIFDFTNFEAVGTCAA